VESWDGVKECTEWSASAIQAEQAPFMMWTKEFIIEDTGYSEDCLYLNVWTGNDDQTDKPVVVYIHGGAFTSGGSSCEVYDGEEVAEKGVVYVSINYRVGILGFLATSELAEESETGMGKEQYCSVWRRCKQRYDYGSVCWWLLYQCSGSFSLGTGTVPECSVHELQYVFLQSGGFYC
jgi:hypothetical protein